MSVIALCMPDEMVRGMMDGDVFVNSITGVITERLLYFLHIYPGCRQAKVT